MSDETRCVRFFGGPLDGRVQELGDAEPIPGTVIRHIHLQQPRVGPAVADARAPQHVLAVLGA